MIERERQGVRWLEFELLQEAGGIRHGVFLRQGGFSQGSFDSLNIGFSVGDRAEAVQANRQLVASSLGLSKLSGCQQVHGNQVVMASQDSKEADGLISQQPQQALMNQHADCQVALFYDPIKKAIANIHCGWRGSVANIYAKAIQALQASYGSEPHNLLVAISPSLGPNNAEFIHYRTELPEHFWPYQVKPNYFDFWEISRHQLQENGVLESHIQIAGIDTYATPDRFFSYRRDRVTGRHATVIALME